MQRQQTKQTVIIGISDMPIGHLAVLLTDLNLFAGSAEQTPNAAACHHSNLTLGIQISDKPYTGSTDKLFAL